MKTKLKSFLLYLIASIVCAIIVMGIVLDNLTILSALWIILIFATLTFLIMSIDCLTSYFKLRARHKKKIKTNEIRLEVKYTDIDNILEPRNPLINRCFVGKDLSDCVQQTLLHAKRWNLQIKSMKQLTTEE